MAIRTTSTRRTQASSAVSSSYVAYNNDDGTVTVSGTGIGNKSLTKEIVTNGVTQANSTSAVSGGPTITSYNVTDASYNNLDDTSVDSAGGYIKINGTGFTSSNLSVYLNNSLISNTFVSSTQIRAVTPAIAVGNYNLFVFCNTAGAIYSTVSVSGFPSFTATSYTSVTFNVNVQLSAIGDSALTYSLYSGTLPTGLTLSANGLISGTVTEASVTNNLVILVNDAQNQTTQQTISLTISSGDSYWKNTVLLLNGESANSANAFYMDESLTSNAASITLFGGIRPTKNTPFAAPTIVDGSAFFDGSGDYIIVNTGGTNIFDQNSDFTVEMFLYPIVWPSTNDVGLWHTQGSGGNANALSLKLNTNGTLYIDNQSTGSILTTANTVAKNTWTHIALVKSGSSNPNLKIYFNGIVDTSTALNTTNRTGISQVYIGRRADTSTDFYGYISNIRYTKEALYTANFTSTNTSLTTTSQNANSANVKLLTLKTNLSSNTLTIIDSSNTAMSGITRGNNSNVMTSSFTPYGSNWSGYFDGTGDYLTVPHNAAFQFGSGDFTVECFVYAQAFASEQVIVSKFNAGGSASSNQWILSLISGVPNFSISTDGQNVANTITGPAVTAQTWTHIAAVRSANTFTVYTNGVAGTSNTNNGSLATNEIEVLGICYRRNSGSTNFPFNGYISNLRITKGQALYTSNFTPTTYVLTTTSQNANSANVSLLTCNSNQFVVQGVLSSNSSVIVSRNGDSAVTKFSPFNPTEGAYSPSIYGASYGFNGLSDVIYLAANPAIAWGAGDFTFECWVYLNASAIPSNASIWDQRGTAGSARLEPSFSVDSTVGYNFYTRQVTRFSSGTAAVKLKQWQHIAVVRSSGTTRLYVDGIQTGGTYGVDGDNYPGTTSRLGQANDAVTTRYWPGYITDVRLTVGTAVYTANTTISTTPLTRLPNTKLLLNGTGCSIFDKTMLNGIFTVGSNTSVRNTIDKFGTSSLFFDGTGDYFVANSAVADTYAFAAGDFTMEGWLYSSANTSSGQGSGIRTIFSTRSSATDTTSGRFTLGVNAANLCFYSGSSNVAFANNSGVTMNTWHHFAATRSNGTMRIFLNGSQVNTAAFAISMASVSNVSIGSNAAGTESWNGYLDELRITKGYARYVANFSVTIDAYSEI